MEFLTIQQKKERNPYKIRNTGNSVKDIDLSKNTLTGFFNTAYYIDSDMDMVLPGAAKKSIRERGPGTTTGNKIKHLKQHDWDHVIARIDRLQDAKVDNIEGIYFESYYSPEIEESRDQLMKWQEGYYDAHSIGFRYMDLAMAERDSTEELYRENWRKYYPMALNPEKADERGYFYIVKEIALFEGSDVAMGANPFTPVTGMKSQDKATFLDYVSKKNAIFDSIMKNGSLTDEGFQKLQMEHAQFMQAVYNFVKAEPDLKTTLPDPGRNHGTGRNSEKQPQPSAIEFFKHL